jgi:RNA polymerase sigma-70 factor (ECF subfamily)
VHLIEKHSLGRADPRRGKFRSFLLACVKNFLSNERDRARAKKRGGGRQIVSFDQGDAEERYRFESANTKTAEDLFDRRWALTLLGRAVRRLRDISASEGSPRHFDRLSVYLTGEAGTPTYAEVAREVGSTEEAVKSSVHRLRRRYGELLREEIADTVADPTDIDDEISELFKALET